jgi:hypothetical protein
MYVCVCIFTKEMNFSLGEINRYNIEQGINEVYGKFKSKPGVGVHAYSSS